MDLVLRFIRCPNSSFIERCYLIVFREKKYMFLLLNSFFQIVLLVETLKRRWKNLLDGFTRYLKKTKDNQR